MDTWHDKSHASSLYKERISENGGGNRWRETKRGKKRKRGREERKKEGKKGKKRKGRR